MAITFRCFLREGMDIVRNYTIPLIPGIILDRADEWIHQLKTDSDWK